MIDSNQSLKFNRTARDAFGHSIEFDEFHFGDRIVGLVSIFIAGILVGMLLA